MGFFPKIAVAIFYHGANSHNYSVYARYMLLWHGLTWMHVINSAIDCEEDEQDNDWLYSVIQDIITAQNGIIKSICENPPTAFLSEMDEDKFLVTGYIG